MSWMGEISHNHGIDLCIARLKELNRPKCPDHTYYGEGPCSTCGEYYTGDELPDFETIEIELEKLKE